jgi:proton-dependent oligopeptide transporter, POT family
MRATPDRLAHVAIYTAIACERFAFYLVLSGLVLAAVAHGKTEGEASSIYGSLLFAVYLTPLFGGWLGSYSLRTIVMLGAGVLTLAYAAGAIGHFGLMLPLMAIGCGCFKPCLATLLSLLYPAGDDRKVKALSTYYLWINLGSLPSSLVGGWLRLHYGWGAAYSAAAVGAFLAVCVIGFAWTRLVPYRSDLGALLGTEVDMQTEGEWKWGQLATLFVGATLFWAANQQQGSTLTFWAAHRVDRHGIAPESFAALNPLFVGVLSLVIGRAVLGAERARLAITMLIVAASFGVLLYGDRNVSYLVLSYFLGALGELLIAPFGMGKVTDLVPRRAAAVSMAGWLLTTAIGGYCAGQLGGLPPETAARITVGLSVFAAGWFLLRWPGPAPIKPQVEDWAPVRVGGVL